MKNVLAYYYNLFPENIHKTDINYYFTNDDFKYYFVKYIGNIEKIKNIYEFHMYLLNMGIYCHQIILNKENQIITDVSGNPYILLKTSVIKEKIKLDDILIFQNATKKVDFSKFGENNNWHLLWEEKIDYYEYQISQFGKKYKTITESFSYFVGMAETGIAFMRGIENQNYGQSTLAHKRLTYNSTYFELYNPLDFIIDSRIRDVCEYFKYAFFEHDDIYFKIEDYLTNARLSVYECNLFLARMFLVTPYFDTYEKIVDGIVNEDKIKKIINKVTDYENLLRRVYLFLKQRIYIERIEWLEDHIVLN